MNAENFVYWCHGFFEIGKSDILTESQVKEIKNHLNLVNKENYSKPSGVYYPANNYTFPIISQEPFC